MLTILKNILDLEQISVAQDLLSKGSFVEGKKSAGLMAAEVKQNQELSQDFSHMSALNNLVMNNLLRHSVYVNAALPHRVAAPFYSRYSKGMFYGEHVDDPVMGQGDRYRSDIAITIFLNSPEEYEGGELIIETEFGGQTIKGLAGSGVMYPASSRHRVAEVQSGQRLVAITWVQSLVSDAQQRDLLYQLYQAKNSLQESAPHSLTARQVEQSYCNLIRMWSSI